MKISVKPEWITVPGLSAYNTMLDTMENRVESIINHKNSEAVYLVEHQDVYTAGTNSSRGDIIDLGNIPIINTGRGGRITYHGPGQRVIYPVLNLSIRQKDIKQYVRHLEQWIINSLKIIGIDAYTIAGKVGIWTQKDDIDAKIGAIGIRVRKWVTFHGISVNINPNILKYKGIIPCGISDLPVTSLEDLGIKIALKDFDTIIKNEFEKVF